VSFLRVALFSLIAWRAEQIPDIRVGAAFDVLNVVFSTASRVLLGRLGVYLLTGSIMHAW